MASPIAIPPELFARLAALDPRCDTSMRRRTEYEIVGAGSRMLWTSIPAPPPASTRRAWYVRVELRGGAVFDIVHASEPALADALLAAVTEAEGRGWDRPA